MTLNISYLEGIEASEGCVDGVSNGSSGCATTIGAEGIPVESVVPDLGSIVEERPCRCTHDNALQVLPLQCGTRQQTVQLSIMTTMCPCSTVRIDFKWLIKALIMIIRALQGHDKAMGCHNPRNNFLHPNHAPIAT